MELGGVSAVGGELLGTELLGLRVGAALTIPDLNAPVSEGLAGLTVLSLNAAEAAEAAEAANGAVDGTT